MPFYHKLGVIPPKRHTQFRKKDGSLYYEQLFGTIGFEGMSTNSYHEHRPTMVKNIGKQYSVKEFINLCLQQLKIKFYWKGNGIKAKTNI